MRKIEIWTDGAALPTNPGPGGIGIVVKSGDLLTEYSVGFMWTTNNRMELMALIKALCSLDIVGSEMGNTEITIHSDSKYVVDSINKGWAKNWLSKLGCVRKNLDLWMIYMKLHDKLKPTVKWVKGHNGDEYNEMCDKLANEAAKSPTEHDVVYELDKTDYRKIDNNVVAIMLNDEKKD